MKGRRRVYIDEELFLKVELFAKDRWVLFKERAPNGTQIIKSFPFALNRYIELKESGGL